MQTNKLRLVVGCVCLALTLGVMPLDLGRLPGAALSVEPIKIGALLDFTGVVAEDGPRFERGIKLRLEQANYQVAGKPIELITQDGESDVTASLDKTKKLVESDKVKIMIGPLMGGVQVAIAPYLRQNSVLALPLINLVPELVDNGNWIAYPSTSGKAYKALGWYAHDVLGYKKMATLGADYVAGYTYLGGVADGFKERGGVVVQQQWAPVGTIDYGPYISAIKKDADFVAAFVIPSLPLVNQYHEFGLKIPLSYVSVSIFSERDMRDIGDLLVGAMGIGNYVWSIDNPANKKFVDAFQTKYAKKPDELEANGYIVTSIALAGLEATGGNDSFDKLRPAILTLKMDTPQGPLSFTPSGIGIADRLILQVRRINGENVWVPIHTFPES